VGMAPPRNGTAPSGGGSMRSLDIVRAVESPDATLVARVAAGDERALAELWQRHGPLVFGLARRLTGSRNLAEDVAQEVFVALWSNPGRFDPARGTLRAYLAVHARRRAIDALRRDSRRVGREQRHSVLTARERAGVGAVTDEAEHIELSGTIKEAIDRLRASNGTPSTSPTSTASPTPRSHGRLGSPRGPRSRGSGLPRANFRTWLGPVLEATP
jgi:RNA polymerase sigma factor (sigma-70 family)